MKRKFKRAEIKDISGKILKKILSMDNEKAKIIALQGDLGAGKTTLTQELARLVGIKENVISPTYIIMKIYKISPDSLYYSYFKKLIHIDAYRMETPDELLNIGWQELQKDKDNLIIIEWPERVIKIIPDNTIKINLSHIDKQTRSIVF